MIVKVKLYAPLSFTLGKKELTLEIPEKEEVSVDEFLKRLIEREKRLQKFIARDTDAFSNFSIIVDQQIYDAQSLIKNGDQVAILSPVSGG